MVRKPNKTLAASPANLELRLKRPRPFEPTADWLLELLGGEELLLLRFFILQSLSEQHPSLQTSKYIEHFSIKEKKFLIGDKLLFDFELSEGEKEIATDLLLGLDGGNSSVGRPPTKSHYLVHLMVSIYAAESVNIFRNEETEHRSSACDLVAEVNRRRKVGPMSYSGVRTAYLKYLKACTKK